MDPRRLSVEGLALQPWWNMLVPGVMPVLCPWWNMLVPGVMLVVCTGAFAAAAGIAAPTIADPAIASARIAGMIKARPMRMTPPPQQPRPGRVRSPRLAGLKGLPMVVFSISKRKISDHNNFCYLMKKAAKVPLFPARDISRTRVMKVS